MALPLDIRAEPVDIIKTKAEQKTTTHSPNPCPALETLFWAEDVPLEVLRQRESKWLDMLNNWDKWMAKKHKKIRLRCQKGIPPSLRGRAWQYLSGGKVKLEQNAGKFDELDLAPGDPKWLDVIERDLHRQFPFHEMFVARGGHGQQDLFRVLKAYTLFRPEEGYCQAQAPIAAVLLMHMPAEQAFWCLVQICEKYLPGYYSEKLEAIQLDGEILFSLLHKVSPVAYKHLSKQKIDPILYMTEWFMCAFSRTLPWSSVLRVWDMFFCEGVKIIFRVALILLKYTLGSSEKLKSCQGQYETMERLRALNPKIMQETFLVQEIIELPVTERHIEREHLIQLKKWKETRGELQCKSPPRFHGAKAISDAEPYSRKALEPSPSIILPPGTMLSPKGHKAKAPKGNKKEGPEKGSLANGPIPEENGSQTLLEPSPSLLHQSKESLSSRESEDTYL
ncbi:TBC1 domain family member 10A isoform X3 [Anolis carolinensis]|uniref:Rab-GAP TBC domain-containing protein n=2 Tax=Anolis carolinensis TaxID=28377 RepID=A0A803TFM1_ANOCA|nr:PREDICTED: TBC1 domain family member 10A [Anolis carolinensis]|eukprot:XP_016852072.1 PREDICTED: TBC1 domain family member 10A [Anolis carolinensis]